MAPVGLFLVIFSRILTEMRWNEEMKSTSQQPDGYCMRNTVSLCENILHAVELLPAELNPASQPRLDSRNRTPSPGPTCSASFSGRVNYWRAPMPRTATLALCSAVIHIIPIVHCCCITQRRVPAPDSFPLSVPSSLTLEKTEPDSPV